MWQKSGNWTGPYCLLAVKNKTCYIQLFSRLISFKSISIKPYFQLKTAYNAKLNKLKVTAKLNKLKAPAKLDKLEVSTKLNKLEAPLPTLEIF